MSVCACAVLLTPNSQKKKVESGGHWETAGSLTISTPRGRIGRHVSLRDRRRPLTPDSVEFNVLLVGVAFSGRPPTSSRPTSREHEDGSALSVFPPPSRNHLQLRLPLLGLLRLRYWERDYYDCDYCDCDYYRDARRLPVDNASLAGCLLATHVDAS